MSRLVMRLLHFQDGKISLTRPYITNPPPYAILSHTWDLNSDNEVTFSDISSDTADTKPAFPKIRFCGSRAISDGLQYFWVDTCCIDKSNSTELSEAINSMFRWYQNATRCYVYLADVSSHSTVPTDISLQLNRSRWFTRAWTLQELIAPSSVEFFTSESDRIGDKTSLEAQICAITQIAAKVLRGGALYRFSVEERKSWAKGRTATREEDMAYSMLGLFGIHMPLIYGEGKTNAFRRLNEEIEKSLSTPNRDNESIFEVLSPFFHLTGPPSEKFDEHRFINAASVAFRNLDLLGRGYLTVDALKDFYLGILRRVEFHMNNDQTIIRMVKDLDYDEDGQEENMFVLALQRLFYILRRAHERYLWNQLVEYGQQMHQVQRKKTPQLSWGWERVASSRTIVFRDGITGKNSTKCYPLAHRESFSMMRMNALGCIDILIRLQDYFVHLVPREAYNGFVAAFGVLRELTLQYTKMEDFSHEFEVNSLDTMIIDYFICRSLADDVDTPPFLPFIELLVDALKPLWLLAAVTSDRISSLIECLHETYTQLETRRFSERHEIFGELWRKKDIGCLVKLISLNAPDWDKLRAIERQIITHPQIPALITAAEDVAYNHALQTPMVLEWKSVLISKYRLRLRAFPGRMSREYRSSTLKATLEDHSGQHNGLEITKKWQEGLEGYSTHEYLEFKLNLTM
ncbi:heterokaryon incompatibility protein-domain-containing protein [Xylariaceae sp. AK1471]|nr:heterokaryon incompatibility protein-domain-containing protein [Xylariaceae sp. AK1471]